VKYLLDIFIIAAPLNEERGTSPRRRRNRSRPAGDVAHIFDSIGRCAGEFIVPSPSGDLRMNPFHYAKNFYSDDYLAQQLTWAFGSLEVCRDPGGQLALRHFA
jgi:hypothetical protein